MIGFLPQACALPLGLSHSTTLKITGSSTVKPLIQEIAERYEIEHPGTQVEVEAGGSGRGLSDARQGLANIGMVSRALTDAEADLQGFPLAKDGISMLVHKNNPIAQLTNEQIIAIYTDQINNWQEVGGKGDPIIVVNKAEGHSTLELFESYFDLESDDIIADQIIRDNEEAIATIQSNENAIGYVSIGSAEYEIVHGKPIKLLPIQGVMATILNVENDTFPLTRTLNLVTDTPPTGLTQDFINYAQSEAVEDLVREQSFIPLVQ